MLWRQQVEEVTEVTIRLHDARAEADRASVDGARINLDLGMIEAQLEASRRQLLECDAALARFAKGTFGYCGHCGKNIDAARLASMPATPVCASCQFWSRRA
jgi:RNA polymerase-binding transcription factor DksA